MKNKILIFFSFTLISVSFITAQTLKIDVTKSTVNWKGTKKIGEHSGVIAIKNGHIIMKEGEIVGGEVIINMKGITILDTEDEDDQKKIIKDISSKQFFYVEEHPTAKAEIKGVFDEKLLVILTIKGISKQITFKTSYKMIEEKLVMNTVTFTINRQDWNLKFKNWFKEKVLDDPIQFKIHIEAQ